MPLNAVACMLQFREAGYDAVDMICDYLEVLPYAPVVPAIQVSTASVYTAWQHVAARQGMCCMLPLKVAPSKCSHRSIFRLFSWVGKPRWLVLQVGHLADLVAAVCFRGPHCYSRATYVRCCLKLHPTGLSRGRLSRGTSGARY